MATAKKKVKLDSGYLDAFMPSHPRSRFTNYGAQMMAGAELLTEDVLQSAYIHNGFARLICDKPAEEMTRAGFEIEGLDDDELEEQIQSTLEELDAVKHFNEAIKWRRAFGGSLIILGINDGGALTDELNEERITEIDFMRVADRYEARPSTRYSDPENKKFGMVETYQITPKNGNGAGMYYVHETRTLRFDGEAIPNDIRVMNDGWGASVIQNAFIQLTRLDKAHKTALLLLERMQQAVHGIPGLSTLVNDEAGGAEQVQKRLQVVDVVRSAVNTIAIDALESYEIKQLSVSGVNEILDRFAEALSSVTGIPVFILMGRSVGGLNSTGDASKEGWYAQVESWQNDQLRRPLDRLISLIILAYSGGKTDGEKYTIEFNPLYAPNEKDQADIDLKKAQTRKSVADALMVLVNGSIIDQDEAREYVRDDYELKGDAPEIEESPLDPIVLNEGQKIVPHPNNVGTKKVQAKKAKK